jgi:hypothetical protein
MAEQPILQFDVAYPERNSRLLIFVKWLLIIPHAIVLSILFIGLFIVTFIAWFAILITGRYPRGMWDFSVGVLRWTANIGAYLYLQRDEYPPFSLDGGDYPVQFHLDYPERLSRWKIFLKWLLILPSYIVYYILMYALYFVWVIAWFAILILGRYPRGLFDFMTGVQRWGHRINVYLWLLTDAYPPFTLGNVPSPTSRGDRPLGTGGMYQPLPPPTGQQAAIPPSVWGTAGSGSSTAWPQQDPAPATPWGASAAPPVARVCPQCGNPVGADDLYCGNCGAATTTRS